MDVAPYCGSLFSNGRKVVEEQYVVNGDRFREQLDIIRRCVGALQERAGGSSLWEQRLLANSFAELHTALNELSMTQEALKQHLQEISKAERIRQRLEFLLETNRVLSSSLEYGTTLDHLARLVVPRFADWCAIDLIRGFHSFCGVAVAHVDPAKEDLLREVQRRPRPPWDAPAGLPKVLRTGEIEFYPAMSDSLRAAHFPDPVSQSLLRQVGTKSLISVPLRARGELMGAITFGLARPDRRYGWTDLSLAQELAHDAATAIDNASRYRHRGEILRTLQESLSPPELPSMPGIEAAAWYRPAETMDEVGGDFYDLFEAGDGAWDILIGDVCGKGVSAATVAALVRHAARVLASPKRRPGRILGALNDLLLRQRPSEVTCTALYGRLEPTATGARLTTAAAGHPCPLLARAGGIVASVGQPGLLLGICPRPERPDHVLDLQPGDTLVFYTDGVTEAGVANRLFGEERLARLVGACPGLDPAGLVTRIQRAVMEFQGGSPRDDIAVVVLRVAT
jgi:serine phosphatase RsbU (regulator of sigma subunit)